MTIYYDENGFYDSKLGSKKSGYIPADAIPITSATHQRLLAEQSKGFKKITKNNKGNPVLIDLEPNVNLQKQQLLANLEKVKLLPVVVAIPATVTTSKTKITAPVDTVAREEHRIALELFKSGGITDKAPFIDASDGEPIMLNQSEFVAVTTAAYTAQAQRGLLAQAKYAEAFARLPLANNDPLLTIEGWLS